MEHYDFNKVVPRRHTGSYKWDSLPDGVIPLWVADMDFQAAPAIRRAVEKRAAHGVFGYTKVDRSYYDAVVSWFHRRHQWDIKPEWIIYTTGVVPAISVVIRALALPGEHVLIQTPVYNCFFSSIRNQGCVIAENKLLREGDTFRIDWDDFERQCADPLTTVFLLCNPHNPVGRMWTREELDRMGDICRRHGVTVVSDEIHGELAMPGFKFTPFASISPERQQQCITLNSPSKSFNIAGLQMANIICSDPERRRRIDRVVNIYELCDVNPFAPEAVKAAYNESEDWLDQLCQYIWGNYELLKERFSEGLPSVTVIRLEGTYLAWVDIRALGLTTDEATHKLLYDAHVYVNPGTMYGQTTGEGYLRINLACPRPMLEEGLRRIVDCLRPLDKKA